MNTAVVVFVILAIAGLLVWYFRTRPRKEPMSNFNSPKLPTPNIAVSRPKSIEKHIMDEKSLKKGSNLKNEITVNNEVSYSTQEIAKHCHAHSAWIIIGDGVYDISKFLNDHPGGEQVLFEVLGKNATSHFEEIGHSNDARKMLLTFRIGRLQ
ncbi:hypothetical protein HDV06_006718 [Boothiomyces sp. JEL0866]|nr:hypothetical protein HDV06_006718 [Boothiomyces sp. JEL0866]